MKVLVERRIMTDGDICDFWKTTEKFGKKFYTLRYETTDEGADTPYRAIHINAVAVSRDLIYKIEWVIGCVIEEDRGWPKSWKPKSDWERRWFYPYNSHITGFEIRGFIEQDSIVLI